MTRDTSDDGDRDLPDEYGRDTTDQPDAQTVFDVSRRDVVKAAGAGAAGLTFGTAATGSAMGGVPTPRLHTDGRWIRDPEGNEVKLRGIAPADPGFYELHHPKGFEEVLEWVTDTSRGWHPNVVRLPCTQDSIDSMGLETYVTEVLRPAVDLLATRNVYALVDFHLIRPYTQEATETYNSENEDTLAPIDDVMTAFWERVAPEFADDEHVIYELFNEPTQPTMYGDDEGAWQAWRDAAQPWVDLVQDHAPETPLIIGSPRWTSVTHMAPEYPFDGENLIYAAHIYPDNGAPSEFDEHYGEPANDVPVVVTEFGWEPEGGSVDQGTTSGWGQPFRDWVEGYANMGWISWCFDDSWAPTFFESPNQGGHSDWTLKTGEEEMGGYIKSWLEETKDQDIPGQTIDDSTAPPAPSGLTITRTTEIGAEFSWDGVSDRGDAETAGLSHYTVYVDGERRDRIAAGTTQASIQGLDPSSTYELGVSAVDEANNESGQTTTVLETIGTDAEQTPYAEHTVPGTIQAEDFDEGGNGVAYYDTSEANEAGADYRDTAVDIGTSTDEGYNVGYINQGEWLEYTIDVETGGQHVAFATVASGADQGGSFRLELDRSELATQDVWNTGGWSTWQQIRIGAVDLPAGEHVLRVYAEEGAWNFDSLEFTWEGTGNGNNGDTGGEQDTTAPTTPTDLSVTGASPSSVEVDWDGASDSGGSGLDHYDVYVDGSLDQQVSAETTSATVADLSADTSYEVAVAAVDGAGNASDQTTVSASTDSSGSGGEDDTTPPTTPSNLSVTDSSTVSLKVAWDAASDSGTGVAQYTVYVDGSQAQTVGAGTTAATISGLSADTTYQVGVSAVDGAGNESGTATVSGTTDGEEGGGGSEPDNWLVVNDYDGDPAWPNGNDLGNWNGAGSFQNGGGSGEVVDGALELQYDNAGWFVEQIMADVSAYSELVLEVSGASGGEESQFVVSLGGVRDTLANLAEGSIGTSTSEVRIDLDAAGVNASSPGEFRMNFWQGERASSTIAIEEIRFE